jgi:hypothetical protein
MDFDAISWDFMPNRRFSLGNSDMDATIRTRCSRAVLGRNPVDKFVGVSARRDSRAV